MKKPSAASKTKARPNYDDLVAQQLSLDTTARLFAFTNFTEGYKPVFSPQRPVIVLRAKQAKPGDAHPAGQWEPFATAVYQGTPSTHAVYVADGSLLGDAAEADENTTPFALGKLLKPIAKAIVKLNPAHATLVAAGPTAKLAIKLVTASFTGAFDFIGGIALVQPPAPDADLDRLVARGVALPAGAAPVALLVLAKDPASQKAWEGWTAGRKLFNVKTAVMVPGESLFTALAQLISQHTTGGDATSRNAHGASAITATGGNRATRITAYQVKFIRSPYTKQVEQEVELAHLDQVVTTTGDAPSGGGGDAAREGSDRDSIQSDEDDDDDDEQQVVAAEGGSNKVRLFSATCNPAEYIHVGGTHTVHVSGIMLDDGRVGNAYGIIAFRRDDEDAAAQAKRYLHKPVSFIATLLFVDGYMCLSDLRDVALLPAAKPKHGPLLCAMDAVPRVNHSNSRRLFGCIVIRGRKCALVRGGSNNNHLRFPLAPMEGARSATETAIVAACTQLDVSRDNFSIRSDIAPVVYYPPNTSDVVTLFAAFATYLPPGGAARDLFEEDETPEDPYDWFTAQQAAAKLRTAAEREALATMVSAIRRAADSNGACCVSPLPGLGVLGDPGKRPDTLVCFLHHPAAEGIAETVEAARKLAAASDACGSFVVALPDGACPSRKRKATVKAVAAAFQDSNVKLVFVPVHPAAELDLVLYELAPDISDKLWVPTRLLTVADGHRVPKEASSLKMLEGATSGATVVSAVCESLEQCDVALLQAGAEWSEADLFTLARGLNRSATICDSLGEARQAVNAVVLDTLYHPPQQRGAEAIPTVAATVAVLQFDQTGLSAVPLFTPRVEGLINCEAGVNSFRDCGVLHMSGYTWLCSRPHHQAEWRLAGGRLRVLRGPAWPNVPGHWLKVAVVCGSDAVNSPSLAAVVSKVEDLMQRLACKSKTETETMDDTLAWNAEDEDGEDATA